MGLTWQGNTIKKKEGKNKAGTDGGLPAKPASQVLSLAWQCNIVFHVAYSVSLVLLVIWLNYFCLVYTNSCEYAMPSCFSCIFHPRIMCLPYIKVVIFTIMHEWVLKSEFYCFFLSVLLDNSKSIKRKEVSKAADKGAPSHPQDDFQDNTCIDTQRSGVDDEHVSPSAPSQVLPLTWHCYM